jgi:DNA-directed RNA polymerase subunit omega
VALREIADETVQPEDVKEDFIHSMQKYVEVDEPEPEEVPAVQAEARAPLIGQDDQAADTKIDRMTEEELLRGLESIAPSDSSNAGPRGR